MKTLPIKFDDLDSAVDISAQGDDFEAVTGESPDSYLEKTSGEIIGSLDAGDPEEEDFDDRWLFLDGEEMKPDGYETMEKFILEITDTPLRQRLMDAIGGKGAFRRFKDIVIHGGNEHLRSSWNQFETDQAKESYRSWLENEGIVPDWN